MKKILLLLALSASGIKAQMCFNSAALPINLTTLGNVGKVISDDFNNDGNKDIVYSSFGAILHLGLGNGTFNNASIGITGTGLYDMVSSDLNGDGFRDMAIADGGNVLKVVLNNGNSTFATPVTYTVTGTPVGVAALDLNSDSFQDIVVSSQSPFLISVFMGNGAGTFTAGNTYNASVAGKFAKGDLNNDGKPDLVIASNTAAHGVLINNNNGGFTGLTYPFATSPSAGLTVNDFNGDGNLDIVSVSNFNNSYCINFGTGSGAFNTAIGTPLSWAPQSVTSGDYNGDGFKDIAISTNAQATYFFVNNGQGVFTYETSFFSGKTFLITDDFNNDGLADLCSTAHNTFPSWSSYVHVLLANTNLPVLTVTSNTAICFLSAVTLSASGADTHAWSGGISNGVAFSPSVTGTYSVKGTNTVTGCTNKAVRTVSVINCGNSSLCFGSSTLNFGGGYIAKSDLNNDGNLDIVSVKLNTVSVYLGTGAGTFGAALNYSYNPSNNAIWNNQCAAGDLNNDGNKDIVIAHYNTSTKYVSILLGNGNGGFSSVSQVSVGITPCYIVLNDFNNDGNADILIAHDSNNNAQTLLGNGSGGFTLGSVIAVAGNNISSAFSKDFNNDGKADIGFTVMFAQSVRIFIGNGNGAFTYVSPGSSVYGVVNASVCDDFDNDGIMDIATANYNSNNGMFVGKGLNNGLFNQAGFYNAPTIQSISRIITGDFNNDGRKDLVVGEDYGGIACYFYLGTDVSGIYYRVLNVPFANQLVEGDFNNDGKLDIISPTGLLLNSAFSLSVSSTNTACAGNTFTLTASGASTYTWSNNYIGSILTTTNITTGLHTVSGTNSLNCINTATYNVSVLPSPTVTVNSGTICSGTVFTLTPSGAITYSYSSGSNTVSPSGNTIYTVSGTGANGCVSSNITSSVDVMPSPIVSANNGTICNGESFVIIPSGNAATYSISGGSATVTPQSSGPILVYGTGTNGCVSTAASNILVHQLPLVTINSGTICEGNTFSIVPAGANSYTFINGSSSVGPPVGIYSYTVLGEDLNGCIGVPAVSHLTVNGLPVLSVSNNNAIICLGESTVLTATGASTYSWSEGITTTGSNTFTPQSTTIYTVTGISAEGCMSSAQATVTVDICTGISTMQPQSLVSGVYPNPFQQHFTVYSPHDTKAYVYDTQGKLVEVLNISKGNTYVDCANWLPGLYFLRVEKAAGQSIHLVKE